MASSKALTPRKFIVYLGTAVLVLMAVPWLPTFIAGATLALLGIFIRVWGCGHLEKNVRLVTTGPYAYVKNPLYVGTFLVAVGGLLAAGSPEGRGLLVWAIGTPLFLLLFFTFYMPRKQNVEEGRLARKFGEDFDKFDQEVPPFVPRFTPYRSGDTRRWQWGTFWNNHEIGMDLLIAALFVVIWMAPQIYSAVLG